MLNAELEHSPVPTRYGLIGESGLTLVCFLEPRFAAKAAYGGRFSAIRIFFLAGHTAGPAEKPLD